MCLHTDTSYVVFFNGINQEQVYALGLILFMSRLYGTEATAHHHLR